MLKRRVTTLSGRAAAVIVAMTAALFGTSIAAAQQGPTSPIVVSTNSGTSLLVDGIEPEKLPAGVAAGAQVCAPAPRVYKSEGERFIFQQWSDGTTDKCIVPTKPGAYRAIYAHEVLVVLKSTAPGVQRSMWVPFAEPVKLEVPSLVQQTDDSRFRFDGWSDGETLFERTNQIAPVKPTTLEGKSTPRTSCVRFMTSNTSSRRTARSAHSSTTGSKTAATSSLKPRPSPTSSQSRTGWSSNAGTAWMAA